MLTFLYEGDLPGYLHVQRILVVSAWDEPHKFYPDRWYNRPDMIRDKRAFAPFGLGRMSHELVKPKSNCTIKVERAVYKTLALTEIRMVIAGLLSTYRVDFPPGDIGEAVERDMKDQLTANPSNLNLIFEPR